MFVKLKKKNIYDTIKLISANCREKTNILKS